VLDGFIGYVCWHRARPILRRAVRYFCRGLWPRRLLGTMIAAAMLTGCAVGPDFFVPDAPAVTGYLPKARAPQASGQTFAFGSDIPGRWWQLFHSRQLNALIEDAIIHNADLEAAEAAVRVAQANALAQRGTLFPVVTANFNPSRQQVPVQSLSSNAASGADIYSLHTAQVSVNFVADVFGGTRRQIEAAEAQVDVQTFQS
jgi:outer membrane protein TolC